MTVTPVRAPFRYRRFVVNALASAGGRIMAILMALLLATIMARLLGLRDYGTWAFFAPLIGYSGLFDFGLSIATERSVARFHALDDRDGIARVINSAMTGSVAISLFVLLCAWLLPSTWYAYLGDPLVVRRCLMVLSVGLVCSNLSLVLGAGLSGLQQVVTLQAQRVGTSLVAVVAVVGLAGAGVTRLDWLLAAYALGPIASLAITWRALVRSVPPLRLRPFYVDWPMAGQIARFAGAIQVSNLSLQMGDQAFRLLVAGRFGPEMLGIYDLAYRAGQTLRSLSSSLLVVMVPFGAARSVVEGLEALSRLHALAMKYVVLFVATGTAAVLFQSTTLLQLWLGEVGGTTVLVQFLETLLIAHGLMAIAGPMTSLGRATGHATPEALTGVAGQLAGLAIAYAQAGPTAALLAFTSCQVVSGAVTWLWLRRLLDVMALPARDAVRLAVVLAVITIAAWALPGAMQRLGAPPVVTLALTAAALGGGAVIMATAMRLFADDERAMWKSLASRGRPS